MKRWTTGARDGVDLKIPGYSEATSQNADAASMHGMLHASAMELVGMGTMSRQAFEVAVDYFSHAKAAIAAMKVDDPKFSPAATGNPDVVVTAPPIFDSSVAAPPRVRSRGRPKELRLKSPIESPGARKRSATSVSSKTPAQEERPRRSARFLKTGVYYVEHCGSCGSTQHRTANCAMNVVAGPVTATKRRCKTCGDVGHNRSTCGRKSTYVGK
jgi:hypothetical protein